MSDLLSIVLLPDEVTYTYDIETGLIVGQPFRIDLDVVGNVPNTYTITGEATILEAAPMQARAFAESEPMAGVQQASSSGAGVVSSTLELQVQQGTPIFGTCKSVQLTGANLRETPGMTAILKVIGTKDIPIRVRLTGYVDLADLGRYLSFP